MGRNVLSEKGLCALQVIVGSSDKYGMPSFDNGEDATKNFLKGRQELIEKGLVELDLDGVIYQKKEFARVVYPMTRNSSSTYFRTGREHVWIIKGPVNSLFIEKKDEGMYELQLCNTDKVFCWAKEVLMKFEGGLLTSKSSTGIIDTDLAETKKETDKRAEIVSKHLCLLMGMEEKKCQTQ